MQSQNLGFIVLTRFVLNFCWLLCLGIVNQFLGFLCLLCVRPHVLLSKNESC